MKENGNNKIIDNTLIENIKDKENIINDNNIDKETNIEETNQNHEFNKKLVINHLEHLDLMLLNLNYLEDNNLNSQMTVKEVEELTKQIENLALDIKLLNKIKNQIIKDLNNNHNNLENKTYLININSLLKINYQVFTNYILFFNAKEYSLNNPILMNLNLKEDFINLLTPSYFELITNNVDNLEYYLQLNNIHNQIKSHESFINYNKTLDYKLLDYNNYLTKIFIMHIKALEYNLLWEEKTELLNKNKIANLKFIKSLIENLIQDNYNLDLIKKELSDYNMSNAQYNLILDLEDIYLINIKLINNLSLYYYSLEKNNQIDNNNNNLFSSLELTKTLTHNIISLYQEYALEEFSKSGYLNQIYNEIINKEIQEFQDSLDDSNNKIIDIKEINKLEKELEDNLNNLDLNKIYINNSNNLLLNNVLLEHYTSKDNLIVNDDLKHLKEYSKENNIILLDKIHDITIDNYNLEQYINNLYSLDYNQSRQELIRNLELIKIINQTLLNNFILIYNYQDYKVHPLFNLLKDLIKPKELANII